MKINLDQLNIDCSGEGELGLPARQASLFAEQILRRQIRNPNLKIEFTGKNIGVLAHLAQLESWAGEVLFCRNYSAECKAALKEGFDVARKFTLGLEPLSPMAWKSFIDNASQSPDSEFLNIQYNVSVVVPCYRPSQFVEYFAKSAKHWARFVKEIIVVSDGNSPEDNEMLSERLGGLKNCVILERTENNGPGAARNHGIKNAEGKFVSFLDFDDSFDPELFAMYLKIATSSGKQLMCSHLLKLPMKTQFFARRFSFPEILYKNQVAVNLIFERTLIETLPFDGPFNEKLVGHFEDWELNIALRLAGLKPTVIGLCSYHYYIHDQGRQLSPVASHWCSRKKLAHVYERVAGCEKKALLYFYLNNLMLQKLAQKEHESYGASLFLRRGQLFLTRLQSCLQKLPGGTLFLRGLSKVFQWLS